MKKIKFDYSLLKGLIVEKFGTSAKFAEAMGWAPNLVSYRLRNGTPWRDDEIYAACGLLGISQQDIPSYFFVPKF